MQVFADVWDRTHDCRILQNEILLYVYYTYISHILIYVNVCLSSFKQLISRHFGRTFGPDTSRLGSQHTGSSNSARQAVNRHDNWCRNSFMKYEHVVRKWSKNRQLDPKPEQLSTTLPCSRSVKIWAVTVQNEPEHNAPWEACCYTAKDAWPWPWF